MPQRGCRSLHGRPYCCQPGWPFKLRGGQGEGGVVTIRSFGSSRRTTPLLAGGLLILILIWFGERAWSERKVKALLPSAPTTGRNVLLIVWDTVRTNNLSLYGYRRPTSPNLDRLARQGVRFDRAFAAAPWTLASHSSMFTGRWAHELSANWLEPLDATYPTVAEFLSSKGYDTAGFVGNLDYCSRETGLARGFAHYDDYPITPWDVFTRYVALGNRVDWVTEGYVLNRLLKPCVGDGFDVIPHSKEHAKNAEMIDRSFLKWLDSRQGRSRPFFAFLNYNDAHSPYEVPDRSIPAFGLRPISYVDLAILQSWEKVERPRCPINTFNGRSTYTTTRSSTSTSNWEFC